jgi:hypothetical protein
MLYMETSGLPGGAQRYLKPGTYWRAAKEEKPRLSLCAGLSRTARYSGRLRGKSRRLPRSVELQEIEDLDLSGPALHAVLRCIPVDQIAFHQYLTALCRICSDFRVVFPSGQHDVRAFGFGTSRPGCSYIPSCRLPGHRLASLVPPRYWSFTSGFMPRWGR